MIIRGLMIFLGTLALIVGGIGVVMPLLPTTPFVLLAAACYAKGSTRFHRWLTNTRLYQKHVKTFAETHAMTRKQKWTLMLTVDAMLVIPFFTLPFAFAKPLIVILVVLKYAYFFLIVKTVRHQA